MNDIIMIEDRVKEWAIESAILTMQEIKTRYEKDDIFCYPPFSPEDINDFVQGGLVVFRTLNSGKVTPATEQMFAAAWRVKFHSLYKEWLEDLQ